jgi:hypothetical protein
MKVSAYDTLPGRKERLFGLFRLLLALSVVLLCSVTVCYADVIIDPASNPFSSFSVNGQLFTPTGQSFTADVSDITWIGMFTSICGCDGQGFTPIQFQLSLLNGAGTSGTLVATRTAVAPWGLDGFLYFDFSGTSLTVGNSYTAVFTQLNASPPEMGGASIAGTTDVYSGGEAFEGARGSGGPGMPRPDLDFYLRVLSTQEIPPLSTSPVPEPSGLVLLGAGFVGVVGAIRHKMRG